MTVYPKYITFVAGEYPIISHEFGDIAPRKDADMSTPNEINRDYSLRGNHN